MKLYRIIAAFVCLMFLASAGAWADGTSDITAEDKDYTFIYNRHGKIVMNDDGIVFSNDAKISGRVTDDEGAVVAEDFVFEKYGDELYTFPSEGIEYDKMYKLAMQSEGNEDNIVEVNFIAVEAVEFDAEKSEEANKGCDIEQFSDGDNSYAVVVYTEEDSFVWHFIANVEDVRCSITDSDNSSFDSAKWQNVKFEKSEIPTKELDFGKDGERTIVFNCGDDYEVVYRIIVCGNSDKFAEICGGFINETSDQAAQELTDESAEGTTVKPTDEPEEETTEEPTEAPTEKPTEKPTGEPTEEPTEAPTEAPTAEPTAEPTPKPGIITLYGVESADEDEIEFELDTNEYGEKTVTVYEGLQYKLSGTCSEGVDIAARSGPAPLRVEQTGTEWTIVFSTTDYSEQKIRILDENDTAEEVALVITFMKATPKPQLQMNPMATEEPEDTDCEDIVCNDVYEGDKSISGTTEKGAEVMLYCGSEAQYVSADEEGRFEFFDLLIKKDEAYFMQATDAAGNKTIINKIEVKEYAGSDEEIEIALNFGHGVETELNINGTDGITIDISMRVPCDVQLYAAYNDNEAKQVRDVIKAEECSDNEDGIAAHASEEISAEKLSELEDGTYKIFAKYDGMFADYESEALVLVIDSAAPEKPVFSADEIADDAELIYYVVAEDCTTELLIDGEKADVREAVTGENTFYELPELKAGMKLSIAAIDKAGNRSVSEEKIIIPSKYVGAYSIDIPGTSDAFEPVVISGSFLTLDANAKAEVVICYGEGRMAAVMGEQIIADSQNDDFDYSISFSTLPIDMSAYPVDTDITVEIIVTADNKRELLATGNLRLAKDSMQLMLKIMLFAIVLIGFIAAVVAFVKVNGRLSIMRKATLDAGNDSNLTIRRRGYDRAVK